MSARQEGRGVPGRISATRFSSPSRLRRLALSLHQLRHETDEELTHTRHWTLPSPVPRSLPGWPPPPDWALVLALLLLLGAAVARRFRPPAHDAPPVALRIQDSPLAHPRGLGRRQQLVGQLSALSALWPAGDGEAATQLLSDVHIPLILSHGAYCCEYAIKGGHPALALVDTGSPFLIMPGQWDSAMPRRSRYRPTYAAYASEEGLVTWNEGAIVMPTMFRNVTLSKVVYGVFQTYQDNGGGAGIILGLIRNRQREERPTFLEQTNIRSFCLDFRLRILTLSPKPLIAPPLDSIPLVDLRAGFPCTVQHYVCVIDTLEINGSPVRTERPIYGLLDTGCTGMLVHSPFYLPLRRAAGGFSHVALTLRTAGGRPVRLSASRRDRRFLVLPATFPWLPADACLVVIGMALLTGRVVTIDPIGSRMTILP